VTGSFKLEGLVLPVYVRHLLSIEILDYRKLLYIVFYLFFNFFKVFFYLAPAEMGWVLKLKFVESSQ